MKTIEELRESFEETIDQYAHFIRSPDSGKYANAITDRQWYAYCLCALNFKLISEETYENRNKL